MHLFYINYVKQIMNITFSSVQELKLKYKYYKNYFL